jgi:hypothetical protein
VIAVTVHTCPRCDLRFLTDSELRAHLLADHDLDPAVLQRTGVPHPRQHHRVPPDPRRAGATDPDRVGRGPG